MMKDAKLSTCWKPEKEQYISCRGVGMYAGHGWGIDHIFVSKTLCDRDCVMKCEIVGDWKTGNQFFGSDHTPVFMKLCDDWPYKVKKVKKKIDKLIENLFAVHS